MAIIIIIIIIAAVVIPALVASLTYLVIQVREARSQEARASWLASPWGQVQSLSAQAEDLWKTVFQKTYQQTGGNSSAACLAADVAARPYFEAVRIAEEEARKVTGRTILNKDRREG